MLKQFFMFVLFTTVASVYADSHDQRLSKILYKNHDKILERIAAELTIKEYAISRNAKYILVLRIQTKTIEILSANDFSLLKSFSIKEFEPLTIDFLFDLSSRQSFLVGMGASNKILEILYEDNPLPVYNGVMHDYRLGEGLVRDQSHFPVRFIPTLQTGSPILSTYFDDTRGLLFIARANNIEVIQLDARQTIAEINLKTTADLSRSKITILNDTPHLFVHFYNDESVTMINMNAWTATTVK